MAQEIAEWDWKADGSPNDCGGNSLFTQSWQQGEDACQFPYPPGIKTPSNWTTPIYPGALNGPTSAVIDEGPAAILAGFSPNLDSLTIGNAGELVLAGGGINFSNGTFDNSGLVHGYTNQEGIRFGSNSSGHINSGIIEADAMSQAFFHLGDGGVDFINEGTLSATNSGILALYDATFINTNGSIESHDESEVWLRTLSAQTPILIH